MPSSRFPPGISHDLARWRSAHIDDLRYCLNCTVDRRATVLRGEQQIRFRLRRELARTLLLDFRPQLATSDIGTVLRSVTINGRRDLRTTFRIGHLHIPAQALAHGENCIALEWSARIGQSGSALTRYRDASDGNVYLYTLFVPADASSVFACFDQPDLKARFSLTLTVPAHWQAISNASVTHAHDGARLRTIAFCETEPLSTYAFAFAAGPFVALASRQRTETTRLWVRESQRRRARRHVEATLRLNRAAVRYGERYFAHPFPFAKYDLVLLPQFPYRGMEHAGATFLNEDCVLLPRAASAAAQFERAQLILHETAHQWMGDLVTMRWFDDLWIKEGFANFIAYKLAERICSAQHARIAFYDLKTRAYDVDATRGATALNHPVADLIRAKSAYNTIVYAKAPAVLRMLEHRLGARAFRTGVQMLVREHAYGAIEWRDLIHALERASHHALSRWAKTWLLTPGAPARADAGIGMEPHEYALITPDADSVVRATRSLARTRDPLRRMHLWEHLWRAVCNFSMHPLRLVELAVTHAGNDNNELTIGRLSSRLRIVLERMLDCGEQEQVAPAFESLAWKALRSTRDAQARVAWTRALWAWSRSATGDSRLLALHEHRRSQLGPSDRLALAAVLVAAGRLTPAHALEKLSLPSRSSARRVAQHCLQAASPHAEHKRRTFARWLNESRLPDAWIDAALPYFNHPAHAALTQPLLRQALDASSMLLASRKIFFVNRWLASFIGGQRTATALRVIHGFLERTDLESDLRLKIFESADALERDIAVYRHWHRGLDPQPLPPVRNS